MVGWYFMHLKFEKRWVYLLIVPACVMAVFLTLMLCPDMAMKPVDDDIAAEEEAWVRRHPTSPRPPRRFVSRSWLQFPTSARFERRCSLDSVRFRRARSRPTSTSRCVGDLPTITMSVSRSYRRGILVVVNTILVSAILSLIAARGGQSPRAARTFGDQAMELGRFRLEERSGRTVTQDDMADRVWIGSFIFTRCPLSCPRISSVMKGLQEKLAGSHVLLVSLSVDPNHDTPAVLADYARRFGADADRWWFLTGDRASIYELIRDRFKLTVMENPATNPASPGESILHSDRLALVDRGRIIGLFDSNDSAAIDSLLAQARRRATPEWIRGLPSVNASLNALCALFLVLGWILIREKAPSVRGW